MHSQLHTYPERCLSRNISSRRLRLQFPDFLVACNFQRDARNYLTRSMRASINDSETRWWNEESITPGGGGEGEGAQMRNVRFWMNFQVFAPNILHCVKPSQVRSEVSAERAEERIDVINVVRTLLEHTSTLFTVPAALLDEVYLHMMDTHPGELDMVLSRRVEEWVSRSLVHRYAEWGSNYPQYKSPRYVLKRIPLCPRNALKASLEALSWLGYYFVYFI